MSTELKKLYSFLQDSNPEKFNERTMHLKEEDEIIEKIKDACMSLESVEGVKFLDAKILDTKKIYQYQKTMKETNYEDSRVIDIEIKFLLEKDGEREEVTKIISFPKLLDGCYYFINNVKYYPIFQLFDAETYKTKKSVTMRTSLQPIVICKNKTSVTDINLECEINNICTFSKIFKVKLPILLYYFANFGVNGTIKYFNLPFELTDDEDEITNADENTLVFKLGKKYVNSQLYLKVPFSFVDEEENENYENNEILLLTFLDAFKKNDKIPFEKIDSKEYWIKKLGSNFTKNTSNWFNKGESVKKSFERLFDNTTRKIIRLEENDKKDIYTLIRWFLINYNNLLKMNNNDMANKRLRLNECFIYPLLKKWTDSVLRLLNGRKTTLKNLKTLFSNLPQDFLVSKCVVDTENLRYSNLVNTIDVCARLKVTSSGPQSISNSSGEIKGKDLDISMLGKLDLVYTSNADPGTTRMLTPFAEITDSWHFSDSPNILANTFSGEEYEEDEEDIMDEEFEEFEIEIPDFD